MMQVGIIDQVKFGKVHGLMTLVRDVMKMREREETFVKKSR